MLLLYKLQWWWKNRRYTSSIFEKDYYERPLIGAKSIMIRSGNKDYSVEIKDPSILDVKIDLSSPIGMGNLDIYPKQKEKQLFK